METAAQTKKEVQPKPSTQSGTKLSEGLSRQASQGSSAGLPLFLQNSQPRASFSPGALASTTNGITALEPAARSHPRLAEIQAHEAVHRAQFQTSLRRGSRCELEQDAQLGTQALLGGRSYVPSYSAAPNQTLNFEPVPLMPETEGSAEANERSLNTMGGASNQPARVDVSSEKRQGFSGEKSVSYHIQVSGGGTRGSVNTITDLVVTYDPGDPTGLAVGLPTAQYGEVVLAPPVPVKLYPVIIYYHRELHLTDADGRDVTVTIASNVNFTRESFARATSGQPLTFETLLNLRGDASAVSVIIHGSGPLQTYFATSYSQGVSSLNMQSADAETSLMAGSGMLAITSGVPARFVRAELTAGEQFDSLEAFLVSADAIEIARRMALAQQQEGAGDFIEMLGAVEEGGILDWLGDLTSDMWDLLPDSVQGVVEAVGGYALGFVKVVLIAALIVLLSPEEIGLGVAMLIVGAFYLARSFVSSLVSRTTESIGTGSFNPEGVLGAALLDAVGLGAVIEAITDESMISGKPFNRSVKERWAAGTEGALQIGTLIFGARKAGRGTSNGMGGDAPPPGEPIGSLPKPLETAAETAETAEGVKPADQSAQGGGSFATKGMGGRLLSSAEKAEFDTFAGRAKAQGLVENPNRTGSWGQIQNGNFEEVARIDVAEQGKPGFRGKTHIHIEGIGDHLDPTTKLPGEE